MIDLNQSMATLFTARQAQRAKKTMYQCKVQKGTPETDLRLSMSDKRIIISK